MVDMRIMATDSLELSERPWGFLRRSLLWLDVICLPRVHVLEAWSPSPPSDNVKGDKSFKK